MLDQSSPGQAAVGGTRNRNRNENPLRPAGYLLDTTASWALALFIPTAICQLFGAAVYSVLASSERQSWS
jgi:hypothetical protein